MMTVSYLFMLFLLPKILFPLLLYCTNLCHYSVLILSPIGIFGVYIKNKDCMQKVGWGTHTHNYIWKIYWTDPAKMQYYQLFHFTVNYIFPINLSFFFGLTIFFYVFLKFLRFTNSFLINWLYECVCFQESSFIGSPLFRKFYGQGHNLWNRGIILERETK